MSLAPYAVADAVAPGGYPYGYVPGGYEAVLFGELTTDGQQIALVAEGSDWGLRALDGALQQLTAGCTRDKDPDGTYNGGMYAPATWAIAVQIGWRLNGTPGFAFVPGPRMADWLTTEAIWRTSPPGTLTAPPRYAPGLKPRDYQLDGAAQIAAARRFLLLDDPGLGKTASTLLGLDEIAHRGHDIFPMVIIVPTWDVGDAWTREIAQWVPHWPAPIMHTGPERFGKVARPRGRPPSESIFITTYATARRDAADMRGPLVRLRAATTVLDEIHNLKNDSTQQSQAARRIAWQGENMVGLSGTMITRNTMDAYPPLEALDRRSWTGPAKYKNRFIAVLRNNYDEDITGLQLAAMEEFFAVLAGQWRRVAKEDVLDELPPKIYTVRRPVIPPEWRAAYDDMEDDMLAELPESGELSVMDSLSQLTRLCQLASSAADVTIVEVWDKKAGEMVKKQVVKLRAPSWKCETMLEILAERPGQGVIVFTVSRQLAMIAGQYCAQAGYKVGYVTGVGGGITRRTRADDIAAFQDGRLDVIICTAGAGGTGITLTRAGTVIFLQRPWPLDQAIQPEGRADRIGNLNKHLDIFDVVAQDTVDERVRELLRSKAGQLGQFVRDPRIVRQLLGGRR